MRVWKVNSSFTKTGGACGARWKKQTANQCTSRKRKATRYPASHTLEHRLERSYRERGECDAPVVEQHRRVGAESHCAQCALPLPLLRHLRGRRAVCVLRVWVGARSQQREGDGGAAFLRRVPAGGGCGGDD